jgi:hypothetical protein
MAGYGDCGLQVFTHARETSTDALRGFGIQSARALASPHTATIARKIAQEPHWVKTLDHANAGSEVTSSVWPALRKSAPGASFDCRSTVLINISVAYWSRHHTWFPRGTLNQEHCLRRMSRLVIMA